MTTQALAAAADVAVRVVRIEVHPQPNQPDPLAESTLAQAQAAGLPIVAVRTARIYLIESTLDDAAVRRVAEELLADPVTQRAVIGIAPVAAGTVLVEVHYQPGVMDPVAQSTREAMAQMLAGVSADDIEVRTGFRYDFVAADAGQAGSLQPQVHSLTERALANTVIQDLYDQPYAPAQFAHGSVYTPVLRQVALRELDEAALLKMSREAHLFLSLEEMKAIQDYFRGVGREPTDIELETLAQTWSEHCVHKTMKSTVSYRQTPAAGDALSFAGRPGHTVQPDGTVVIDNLLKSTVAAATHQLMQEDTFREWCISVFKDNSGVVRFDDQDAVCIKVETHNHPSAIEPYGGSATGIGGCIRDVMGTGLAAQPIANTDVFCVAPADTSPQALPKGVIHPKRVLQQVVAGVRDYGNRMGIPTVNGAVYFHPDYLGNPLVYCGCVGMIPLDKCFGQAQAGDHIIALGGATGRDGIHGATFSSAELTDTHADEFSHAVQIGNAITQKKTLDVILQARDHAAGCLYTAITDCGAGGFSSAVGEMGKDTGATVRLDRAPLKYRGLSYTEIWISEAQERMVLAVPESKLETLKQMCAREDVALCDLGTFGRTNAQGQPELGLYYHDLQVGTMSMHFLHDGIPTPTRQATWSPAAPGSTPGTSRAGAKSAALSSGANVGDLLQALLAHPNIASKHWIIRQYDHEVQGGSVVKPLVGLKQDGPSDAAVLRPKLGSQRAIALTSGMTPSWAEKTPHGDAYLSALAAIDECVRNLVCVGAQPEPPVGGIAILDNFCWPSCNDPAQLGSLVRAAEGCYDGAMAYRTPFVSGKDSLNNQFTTDAGEVITIPPTLLITGLGIVPDVSRCLTMDAKQAGNLLLIVGLTGSALGGSHYQMLTGDDTRDARIPRVDLKAGPTNARTVAKLSAQGLVRSAHDCADGGLLVAAAEMAFAGGLGLDLELDSLPAERELDDLTALFAETPSRYLLEVAPEQLDAVIRALRAAGAPFAQIGVFTRQPRLTARCAKHGRLLEIGIDTLRAAWQGTLDW